MALVGILSDLLEGALSFLRSIGQHSELRRLSQALITPLKSGLHSFNTVSEILLSIKADMVLPGCQTFDDIRRQIMNMKLQMEESERIAKTELQQMDRETETLTVEQSQLAQQKKQKTEELNNLNTQLSSLQSTLSSYKEALQTERRNLRSAENTLRDLREKRDDAERLRNIGLVTTLVPFVGWVAGPVMFVVGQVELNEASESVDTARKEVERCESQVNSYSDRVKHYNSLIDQAGQEITAADFRICRIDAKLRRMSEKRRFVADIQAKIRRAVHQLGRLSGVSSVAELQTRRLILLEPVMNVMEEMATIVGQISGTELLYSEGIQSLMEDMRMNHRRLKELANTNQQSLQGLTDYI